MTIIRKPRTKLYLELCKLLNIEDEKNKANLQSSLWKLNRATMRFLIAKLTAKSVLINLTEDADADDPAIVKPTSMFKSIGSKDSENSK